MKKVVQIGNVKVQRVLHVSPNMRGDGLKRFEESKAFQDEKSKDKKIIAQNSQQAQNLINKKAGDGVTEQDSIMAQASKTQKQTTAKKGTAKKAAAKKATPAKKGAAKKAAATEEKGPGKIAQIIELHKKGLSNAEIVEKGFNKTTVSIQVAKYKKENPKKGK